MSFYAPEQRCPRCRTPLTQGMLNCPNCGLALAGMGGPPRASRPGPPPGWEQDDAGRSGPPPTSGPFGGQSSSGPQMYRPGGPPRSGPSDPWGDDRSASPPRPPSGYQQRPGMSGGFSSGDAPTGLPGRPGMSGGFSGGDAPTGLPGRPGDPRPPSAGWNSAPRQQDAPTSSQGGSYRGGLLRGYRDASPSHQSGSRSFRDAPPYNQSNQSGPQGGPRSYQDAPISNQSGPQNGSRSYQDAPTSYQGGPQGGPRSYQNGPAGYRGVPSSYQNRPGSYEEMSDSFWNTPGSWDSFNGSRSAPVDDLDAPAGLYDDEATPLYGRSQAFRGTPAPSWQQSASAAPAGGVQHQYFGYYPDMDEPPLPPRPGQGKKVALVLLILLVLLGGGGGAAYLFIQSKPAITITSDYTVGRIPAGSASTSLHVTGTKFARSSAVSFLIDGKQEPGHQTFKTDGSGALKGDLPITADWALGQHNLTAKDASGNTTILGKTVVIVAQGQANTPGPNGSPPDDATFSINVSIQEHNNDSGEDASGTWSLIVTGHPDPAGGTVCDADGTTGQTRTDKGTRDDGVPYTETRTITCGGTYKGGKITFTETTSSDTVEYSDGVTCSTTTSYIGLELDGSFTDATNISGKVGGGVFDVTCSNGYKTTSKGLTGTWTGIAVISS